MQNRTFFISYYSAFSGYGNVAMVTDAARITPDVITMWQAQIGEANALEEVTILHFVEIDGEEPRAEQKADLAHLYPVHQWENGGHA